MLTKSTLEAIQRFNDAFNRDDIDGVMAAMTEDCVFENTYPPPDGNRYEEQGNKWIGTEKGLAVYREGGVILDVEKDTYEIPSGFALYQNFPNPFNPKTTICFLLPQRAQVTLKVFDFIGREITTLVNQELNPGDHSVIFNAQNLASGVYFFRLQAGSFIEQRKMVLVK